MRARRERDDDSRELVEHRRVTKEPSLVDEELLRQLSDIFVASRALGPLERCEIGAIEAQAELSLDALACWSHPAPIPLAA